MGFIGRLGSQWFRWIIKRIFFSERETVVGRRCLFKIKDGNSWAGLEDFFPSRVIIILRFLFKWIYPTDEGGWWWMPGWISSMGKERGRVLRKCRRESTRKWRETGWTCLFIYGFFFFLKRHWRTPSSALLKRRRKFFLRSAATSPYGAACVAHFTWHFFQVSGTLPSLF